MKKLFSLALAFCLCGVANAQTETYYGAQKGDFSFSIDAKPVIDFAGNIFNGNLSNELKVENLSNAISAKYFLGDKFALTAGLSINNSKTKTFNYEEDGFNADGTPNGNPVDVNAGKYEKLTSEVSEISREWTIGLGAQYYLRPGKRLQPFVGAGIYFGKQTGTYTITDKFAYTYETPDGFEMDPTTGAPKLDANGDPIEKFRVEKGLEFNEYDEAASPVGKFTFMANIGVELFLSKKISVSTALDLGVSTETTKSYRKYENDDKNLPKKNVEDKNYSYKSEKKTTFKTGMGMMGGNVALNFYF